MAKSARRRSPSEEFAAAAAKLRAEETDPRWHLVADALQADADFIKPVENVEAAFPELVKLVRAINGSGS